MVDTAYFKFISALNCMHTLFLIMKNPKADFIVGKDAIEVTCDHWSDYWSGFGGSGDTCSMAFP